MSDERKRYMLFAWEQFYPCGGERDSMGLFDTIDEAREVWVGIDWAEYGAVLDLDTGQWSSLLRRFDGE